MFFARRSGGTGRRTGFRVQRSQGRAGSNPAFGTTRPLFCFSAGKKCVTPSGARHNKNGDPARVKRMIILRYFHISAEFT